MNPINIAQIITEYVNAKAMHNNPEFKAADIRNACTLKLGFVNVAPGSPDRVMRDLRQRNKINYVLVNRAKSLYRALPLENPYLDSKYKERLESIPKKEVK